MLEQNPSPALEANYEEVRLWHWPTLMSLVTTLVILLGLGAMLDIQETWRQVVACDKTLMVLGGLAHYVTYVVRGYRWQRCLAHVSSPCHRRMSRLLTCFASGLDHVAPGKLADVYAAHLVRINCGVRRSTAMGALVFLRMVDAWVVLLLAALASWWLFALRLPRAVLWSLLLGVCVAGGGTTSLFLFMVSKNVLPPPVPAPGPQTVPAFHLGMRAPSTPFQLITALPRRT